MAMMICAPQEQIYGAGGWMIQTGEQAPQQEPSPWGPLLLLLVLAFLLSSGGKGEER